jgi:molybdopterin molybdotransferase
MVIAPMVIVLEHRQRIARLTPLDDVTRRIAECVAPVAPRDMTATAALGATLAQDITVSGLRPAAPLALIDGFAVHAELTTYAETYTPALLAAPREIAVGERLGMDGDAVAPLDAVTWRGGTGELPMAELPITMAPGDGVLLPGADAGDGEGLWPAGHRLRASDVAVLQALGIPDARVRRPRIRIARARRGEDNFANAIAGWLTSAIAADGGEPVTATLDAGIEAVFSGDGADAVIVIGGTGAGAADGSVHALRHSGGVVEAHGIAVSPGETAAFGIVDARPVLLVPGRLDAALAVWMLIGRPLLARLCGGSDNTPSHQSVLTAKIASTVGFTELVLVRRAGDGGVTPIASKYLPLATLAHADGWIVIPAPSEGLAPGAPVAVRPLP